MPPLNRKKCMIYILYCIESIDYVWKNDVDMFTMVKQLKRHINDEISIEDFKFDLSEMRKNMRVYYINELKYMIFAVSDILEWEKIYDRLSYVSNYTIYFAGLYYRNNVRNDPFEIEKFKEALEEEHQRYLSELESVDNILEELIR
jgi:hypothetical protein